MYKIILFQKVTVMTKATMKLVKGTGAMIACFALAILASVEDFTHVSNLLLLVTVMIFGFMGANIDKWFNPKPNNKYLYR